MHATDALRSRPSAWLHPRADSDCVPAPEVGLSPLVLRAVLRAGGPAAAWPATSRGHGRSPVDPTRARAAGGGCMHGGWRLPWTRFPRGGRGARLSNLAGVRAEALPAIARSTQRYRSFRVKFNNSLQFRVFTSDCKVTVQPLFFVYPSPERERVCVPVSYTIPATQG